MQNYISKLKILKLFKSYLIFFFLLIACVLSPVSIFADEGWVIDKYHTDIVIQKNGEVRLSEKIDVDFKDLEKHGIYRDIPYVYESDGMKFYTEISGISVHQNNNDAEKKVTRDNNTIRIRIGDPDKIISGKNSYTIQYTVKGVLRSFSDYDELFWNVTSNNWPVPILSATSRVVLPQGEIQRVKCYEGYAGASSECSSSIKGKEALFSATRSLIEAEGITIVVGYPKGLVPILIIERPKTAAEKFFSPSSLITLFVAMITGIIFVIWNWYKGGRDFWSRNTQLLGSQTKEEIKPTGAHETVVVEFTPPDKVPPAILGVLMDERAHTHDVVATIIDLASRGFLSITEVQKKWMFGKTDYLLKKHTKDTKELLGYEKKLLDSLFEKGDEVKVSSLRTTFYDDLNKVKDELYQEVVKRKLFPTNPEKVRGKYLVFGIVLLVIGGFLTFTSLGNTWIYILDIGLALGVSGWMLVIFSRFMPRRTTYGRDLYRRARGYQEFVTRVEKYRQKFFEKENMFNEVLPYAMIFGVTDKFINAMKDIGLKNINPSWYHGHRAFSASTFNSSMSDFSSSLSSAIASTPKSSGFSSGGSSGGGFGGGGEGVGE